MEEKKQRRTLRDFNRVQTLWRLRHLPVNPYQLYFNDYLTEKEILEEMRLACMLRFKELSEKIKELKKLEEKKTTNRRR